jgi:hypothetical protein
MAAVLGTLVVSCAPKTRNPELKGPPTGPDNNLLLEQISDPDNLESVLFNQKVRLRESDRIEQTEVEICPEGQTPVGDSAQESQSDAVCETAEERARRLDVEIRNQAEESLAEAERTARQRDTPSGPDQTELERTSDSETVSLETDRESTRALRASEEFQRFSTFINEVRQSANRFGSSSHPINGESSLRLFFNMPLFSLRYYRFQGEIHDFCENSEFCPVLVNIPFNDSEVSGEEEYFSREQIFFVRKSAWRSVFPNETQSYLEIETTTVAFLSLGQSIVGLVGSRNGFWNDPEARGNDLFLGFSVSDQHIVVARNQLTPLTIYQMSGDRTEVGSVNETPFATSQFPYAISYGSPEDIGFVQMVPEELWDSDLLALKPQVEALIVATRAARAVPAAVPSFGEQTLGDEDLSEAGDTFTPFNGDAGELSSPTTDDEENQFIDQLFASVPENLPDSVFLNLQENHNRQIQCILLQNNEVRTIFDIFPREPFEFSSGQIDLNQLNDADIYDLNNLVLRLDVIPSQNAGRLIETARPFFQSPVISDGRLSKIESQSPEGRAFSFQAQSVDGQESSQLVFLNVEGRYLPIFVDSDGAHYMNCVTNDSSLRVGAFQHPQFPNEDDSPDGRNEVYSGVEPVRIGDSIIEMSAVLRIVLGMDSPYQIESGRVLRDGSSVDMATGSDIQQFRKDFSFFPAEQDLPVRLAIVYRGRSRSLDYYPFSYVQPKLIPIRNGDGNIRVSYLVESDSTHSEDGERIANGIQQQVSPTPGMLFYRYSMAMDYFPKNCISKTYEQQVLEREGSPVNGFLRRKEMLGICLASIQIEFPEGIDIMVQTDTGENIEPSQVVDVSQGSHPEILTPPAE